MRLKQFSATQHVLPHVAQDGRGPTKDFCAGEHDVEWIDCNESGTRVIIRRGRLPDIVMTAFGYGTLEGDGEVPGNRSGNPGEDEGRKKGKHR